MAMTTVHIERGRLGARPVARSEVRSGFAGIVGLVALAAAVGIVAPLAIAAAVEVLIGGGGGSLGLRFIAITVPTTGIWLHGAIQARRTIRRLAVPTDAADRAAFAELNVLLARES